MELFLYQLSIWGLAATAVLIAMFFIVLARSVRRAEMRWWTLGWLANVGAMAVTLLFWYLQPPATTHGLVFATYLLVKNAYVWMLARGALEFAGRRPRMLEARATVPAMLVFSLAAIVTVTTRDRLGLVSQAIVALVFGWGAWTLGGRRAAHARWLVIALGVRAVLAGAEAAAYGVNVLGLATPEQMSLAFVVPANWILASHYPLDTAAEWILAVGFIVGVSERTQAELRLANERMLSAQDELRRLVDRDPLTGLANRRALPEVLRDVQPRGALVAFFDLNDFKAINDRYGHAAGDQCLLRFAGALSQSFRPTDTVIRYAGDEFVVVASGLDELGLSARIDAVRARLRPEPGELAVTFAYGVAHLEPGGNPEDAIRQADEAMYARKPGGTRRAFNTPSPA